MTQTLVVRKCTLSEVVDAPNFPELAAEYAAESAMAGMPSPVAKIDIYRQLEAAGAFQAFGAFIDDQPIGFIGILYHIIPHYGVGVAISESYFVSREHRPIRAGGQLLVLAEEYAKEIKSPGLLITAPYGSPAALWLMMKSDYSTASVSFFKRLS